MEKAEGAFRNISEVAEEINVPRHVLRFWETRFAQIKPLKRAGGRRFYRPVDVDLLKGIHRLLYGEGYTIKGVQRIIKQEGVAHVAAIGRGNLILPAHVVGYDDDKEELLDKNKRTVPAPPPGRAPLARPLDIITAEPLTIHASLQGLSEAQINLLNAALADLGDALYHLNPVEKNRRVKSKRH